MLALTSTFRPIVARHACVAAFSTGGKGPFARSRKSQQSSGTETVERTELKLRRLAVIGGGNMAEAMITGVLKEGLLASSKIVVSDPNPTIRSKYEHLQVETHTRNSLAVAGADVILVAVKPQVLDDVRLSNSCLPQSRVTY